VKSIFFITILIWIMLVNLGKIFPLSGGERYYRRLQRWYLLTNRGEWEKAKKIEGKIQTQDIDNFVKENKIEELKKRINEITIRSEKNADDWMEIAVILFRLNKHEEALEAIKSAYKLDPIREDISKIYFTYLNSR